MTTQRYIKKEDVSFSGGFGQVTLLHDTYLGRNVLYKSMSSPDFNDQLYNEIKALSGARSRHVVEIYDVIFDEDKNINGIIIEYLNGRNFTSFYDDFEKKHDVDYFLQILFQLSKALSDIHSAGITHRDLKLDNIKSSSSGIIKVFDFGLSTSQDDYITRSNRGTWIYAAPELYQDDVIISKEMDIYAFGICAWALVTKLANFSPALLENPPMSRSVYTSIKSVLNNHVDQEIINILDKTLSINPNDRPTAKNINQVLSRHMLLNKHKGLFVENFNQVYELSVSKKGVKITLTFGEITVQYTGLDFIVKSHSGDVYINNIPVTSDYILPNSCLITFGEPSLKSRRRFITFLSSHPEIVL